MHAGTFFFDTIRKYETKLTLKKRKASITPPAKHCIN